MTDKDNCQPRWSVVGVNFAEVLTTGEQFST